MAGLDALRALAILAVLLMHLVNREFTTRHLQQPAWSGSVGYFGVELFFVLSGFLIGRILIGIAAGNPGPRDWTIFLVRRWMRTLPLYFLWLVVLLAVDPPVDLLATAARYATFTQNLAWPMGGWFSVSWSLAVEEWFYILFSLVLLFLAAARVPGAVLWSCLLFVTLPLLARIFFISPAAPFDIGMREVALVRLDAIAYGVIAAWLVLRAPAFARRWQEVLFLVGTVLLLAPVNLLTAFGDAATFAVWRPYLFTFASIGFALWLPGALDFAMTSSPFESVVRWLSERSYCLYIVHLSMIDLAWRTAEQIHLPLFICTPVALVFSGGLAEISYRYFETPILRLRPAQPAAASRETAAVAPAPVVV